jgi:hypothetical protein
VQINTQIDNGNDDLDLEAVPALTHTTHSVSAMRSSIVQKRCGYKPPDPMLGAQGAFQVGTRWENIASCYTAKNGLDAVNSTKNAIAMHYLADYIHHDEREDEARKPNSMYVPHFPVGYIQCD